MLLFLILMLIFGSGALVCLVWKAVANVNDERRQKKIEFQFAVQWMARKNEVEIERRRAVIEVEKERQKAKIRDSLNLSTLLSLLPSADLSRVLFEHKAKEQEIDMQRAVAMARIDTERYVVMSQCDVKHHRLDIQQTMDADKLQSLAFELAPEAYSDLSKKLIAEHAENGSLVAQLEFLRQQEKHRQEVEIERAKASKAPDSVKEPEKKESPKNGK